MRTVPYAGPARVGLLSTYPPTQCGLATFTAALAGQLNLVAGSVGVVRVVDQPETHPDPVVVAHLVNGSSDSAAAAVRRLNGFDAVIVQHEYGIFGGPDGEDVVELVEKLTVPTIIVLHTVLQEPTPHQREILERLMRFADVIVTMTHTARNRLISGYSADAAKLVMIPHGAIDHRAIHLAAAGRGEMRVRRHAIGRPLVLSWGLLGPGKGIEWAIDAMAGLRDLRPHYLVLGRTHPKVLEHEGELYREGLLRRVADRGVEDLVEFDDSYLGVGDLGALVESADVVLLPYDSREQVTSGVLIEAVAAGRPVVSTAFPHAVEMLHGTGAGDVGAGLGAGLTVPQRDPAALEAAVRRVLTEPGLAPAMAANAAAMAPQLFWGAVAGRYRDIANSLAASALPAAS